ncbi:MAG TPA: ABC transporter permease [Anaerolineales bacterium]|nr:ABC transporter permease [Anaerolineales bacterium]
MFQLIKMAYRNLNRNRRRSILSALAVSLGLALLLIMAATINGEIQGAMNTGIALQTGHLQVRAASYVEEKSSLKWQDLIANPDQVAAQIKSIPHVTLATPRLFATGIINTSSEAVGVQLLGIDPASAANAPIVQGVIAGSFITPDDQDGIAIGQTLAQRLGVKVGDPIDLSANTADGDINEQNFIVRAIFSTDTPSYDQSTVLMPLAKAQAFTATQNHASTIFIMLDDRDQADAVAAALTSPDYQVLTWQKMNDLAFQTEQLANSFMVLFYLIVLGITATVIVNTLIMAVYERTREIGILAAIGMKGRRIMSLFLAEAGMLAVAGIAAGLILGVALCAIFGKYGFYIGNVGVNYQSQFLLGNRIYPLLTLTDAVNLTLVALVITLIASLYPALLAAQLEPVEALHGN